MELAILVPSSKEAGGAAGSKKATQSKGVAKNGTGLISVFERTDLLLRHLEKDEQDGGLSTDNRIEAINN